MARNESNSLEYLRLIKYSSIGLESPNLRHPARACPEASLPGFFSRKTVPLQKSSKKYYKQFSIQQVLCFYRSDVKLILRSCAVLVNPGGGYGT